MHLLVCLLTLWAIASAAQHNGTETGHALRKSESVSAPKTVDGQHKADSKVTTTTFVPISAQPNGRKHVQSASNFKAPTKIAVSDLKKVSTGLPYSFTSGSYLAFLSPSGVISSFAQSVVMLGHQQLARFPALYFPAREDEKDEALLRQQPQSSLQDKSSRDRILPTDLDGSVSAHGQANGGSGLKTDTTNGVVILVLVIAGSVVGGCTLLTYVWHRCLTVDGMLNQPPPIVEPSPDSSDAFHTAHLPGRPHTHAHHHHNPHHQAVVHADAELGHHHVGNRL